MVLNYISDIRNELKWNPDMLYMQKTTRGPVEKSIHFKAKWHMSDTVDEEITRFDPPNNLTFESQGALAGSVRIYVTAVDSATEMEARFIAAPDGF